MNVIKHKLYFDDIPDGCGACGIRGHEFDGCAKRANTIPTLNITLRKAVVQPAESSKNVAPNSTDGPWLEMGANNKVVKDSSKKPNLAKPYLKASTGVNIIYESADSDELQILTHGPSKELSPEHNPKTQTTAEKIDKFFGFSNHKPKHTRPTQTTTATGKDAAHPILCDDLKDQMEKVIGSLSWDQVYHQSTMELNPATVPNPDNGFKNNNVQEIKGMEWSQKTSMDDIHLNSELKIPEGVSFEDYFFSKENEETIKALGLRDGVMGDPLTTEETLTMNFLNNCANQGDNHIVTGGPSTFFIITNQDTSGQVDEKLSLEESNEGAIEYQGEEESKDEGEDYEEEEDPMEDEMDEFFNTEQFIKDTEPLAVSLDWGTPEPEEKDQQEPKATRKIIKIKSYSRNSGSRSKLSSSSVVNKLTNLEMNKSDSDSHSSKRRNWDTVMDTASSDAQGTKKPKVKP